MHAYIHTYRKIHTPTYLSKYIHININIYIHIIHIYMVDFPLVHRSGVSKYVKPHAVFLYRSI